MCIDHCIAQDGESEADAATIRKYYYAPPPYFNDLATELQLFRLLMALEGQRGMSVLNVSPRS